MFSGLMRGASGMATMMGGRKPMPQAPMDTVGPKMGTEAPVEGAPVKEAPMMGAAMGAPQKKGGFGGMLERILAKRAMAQPQGKGAFGMPMPRINTAEDAAAKNSAMQQMMGPKGPYTAGFGMPPKPPVPPAAPAGAPPPMPPQGGQQF